jgi:alpha-tubulin suppressor-like RCC1 family protein
VPAALILLTVLGSLVPAPQAALAASQGTASIAAGGYQSCSIESGKAYCWGDNGFGELGDGSTAGSSVPVAVDTSGVLAGKTLTQIAAGGGFTCALDTAGAAYCWGLNNWGNLGDGSTTSSGVPVAVDTGGVLAGKTLTQIAVGGEHACALDSSGAAYCWGLNSSGELGAGSTADSSVPEAVDAGGVLAGKTLTQITAGDESTCAVDTEGVAYCWGLNNHGQLGDGSGAVFSTVPVEVDAGGALAGRTLITAGESDACALDTAGAAYCWGAAGLVGDGSTVGSSVPVAVDTSGALAGRTLTQITAGESDACALDTAGAAYCWGGNAYGELGDGSTVAASIPVPVDASGVLAGKTLTQITAGGAADHTCSVDAAGAAYCWGDDDGGDLGDDTNGTQSDVPVLAGPQAPTGVTAVPGDATATVSWTAPASLDTGTLTGYTATASPGGASCTTTSATTCTITGLTNGTTYSITVVAHTTAGDSGASTPDIVTPTGGPAFTSDPADTASFGMPFSFTVTAAGSPAPRITRTGRLPSGVRFARHGNDTATISGTPSGTAAGTYPLTLTATNPAGTATQAFTLTITRAPAIRKIPATTATIGVALHLTITTTGYPAPALTESGPLPAGVSFTDHGNGTATITGTPAPGTGGRYPITVTATSQPGTARQTFPLKVR